MNENKVKRFKIISTRVAIFRKLEIPQPKYVHVTQRTLQ